jgi:hypothetical protein
MPQSMVMDALPVPGFGLAVLRLREIARALHRHRAAVAWMSGGWRGTSNERQILANGQRHAHLVSAGRRHWPGS